MKKILLSAFLACFSLTISAQDYEFTTTIDLEATPVISQGNTGTCWSFSASSFLESEIIRLTGKQIDISEMFTVRNTYPKKAWNYVMRQGKAQFSEGGLAHDVMNSVKSHGLVPNSAYSGLKALQERHNHAEMVSVLKAMLDVYIQNPGGKLSSNWKPAIENVLDVYLGKRPESFTYEGKTYTPQSFLEMTKVNPDDYVTLTSFTHQPYYTSFILNIPDNFSNGSFYNVTLDELVAATKNALKTGYTVELDCDVSEATFSAKYAVATIPEENVNSRKDFSAEIRKEKNITAAFRQQEFENYTTTDDHLMHITGMAKDQNGNEYFRVKNSWGSNTERIPNDGHVHMSEAFFKLKTISVMVHKDALPKALRVKLGL
ncbi:bleomycin hydrolase [Kordia periserrulae]|uniref:Aminopeptidase n=1 Tax=Kordia periserrulae TaxID=701523 RepID=A0A2T6C3C4_9FLAO|nr:C1 family peptidase [Kordia periserrulae]PTX62808.1 bleomycin hydrolase [Kordia periserrulae]